MTESELVNFGILNGWLKAIARVNDKTNNGHEFTLIKYHKSSTVHEFCRHIFHSVAKEIALKQEADFASLLKERFNFWFYNFQSNNPLKDYFLEDKNSHFSLSDKEWKDEWVQEFVDLLLTTLKPIAVYTVILRQFEGYYCNVSDDIILVGEHHYFRIHCCLTD